MKRFSIALALLAAAPPLLAQGGARPAWTIRPDGATAADTSVVAVTMPPGWHLTTKTLGAILFDPAWTATGSYRVVTSGFVFPGSDLEGYGVFFGGHDLDGPNPSYLCLLLRKDGRYQIEHRQAEQVHVIVPWTSNPAINHPEPKPAQNEIAIDVSGDSLAFAVNGKRLAAWPRGRLDDGGGGQVGLRLGRGMSVHVTKVEVTPAAR